MSKVIRCPKCDAELLPGTPKGLCPQCALRGALELSNGASKMLQTTDAPVEAQPRPMTSAGRLPMVKHFGDYELLEEIARGGMGIVYKARQKSLNRLVAVKMLLFGGNAGADFIKRFRIEASAAAALQHPNIVAIHEVGVHEGEHFMVMDFVEGPNLARLVKDQILPPKRAAQYLKTIAEAIHYAHEHGILHRDLKPSNVLIDANDQPRVTDFGLAKVLTTDSQHSSDHAQITQTGNVLGSPGYMSPEQAGGARNKVSRRSDVYTLGAMLYDLLTGRAPFGGGSLWETLQQVETQEPVSPRLLNPGVPLDLETICLKCLEKDPDRRYQTSKVLSEELGRFLNGETIHARSVGRVEKLWRWSRRNPTIAAAAAVVCLALAVSLVLLFQVNRARDKEKSLTVELKQTIKDKDKASRRTLQMVGEGLDGIWSEKSRRWIDLESEDVAALSELRVIPVTNTATALRLRIGIATDENPRGRVSQFSEFLSDLEQALGLRLKHEVRINVRIYKFQQDFGADLLSGQTHFGRLGARQFLQLKLGNSGLTPLTFPSTHFKEGVLFTRTNSGIRSIGDARGRRFAFGDTNSTISFWAQIKLAEEGITATNLSGYDFLDSTLDFADEVATSGLSNAVQRFGYLHSHAQVIEGVLEGRYDIGVAAVKAFNAHASRGLVEVPNSQFISSRNAFVAGPGLDSQLATALADAIISMDGNHLQQLPDATRKYVAFPPDAYATEEKWFRRGQELFPYKPPPRHAQQ